MSTEASAVAFDCDPALARLLWDAPRATTLVDLVAAPAAMAPHLVAFVLTHHGPRPEPVTWSELWVGARRRAVQLLALDVRAGDRVVLMLPTCRAFFETFFGVLVAGGIPVPIAPPPSMRVEKLGSHLETVVRILTDADAAAIVGLGRPMDLLRDRLRHACPRVRTMVADELSVRLSLDGPDHVRLPDPAETALLQYTSGSTSDPKGVELTHANLIANVAAIAATIVRPNSSGVSWLPLYHDMGLIGTVLVALYCRRPSVYMPPQAFIKEPAVWLRTVSEYRATTTVAPNFAFGYCVKNVSLDDLSGVSLDCLELALNGAEPIDPDAVRDFESKFGAIGLRPGIVRPVYGLAESALAVTFGDPGSAVRDEIDADRLERTGSATPVPTGVRARVFISVGRPIPTQEVRIADSENRELPERQVGEILARGPSVMKGYFRRPEESSRVLQNQWLHTGDLGYVAEGRLYITGRLKDLIIRNGKNYYGQDIERRIAGTPGLVHGGTVAFGIEERSATRVVIVAETRARDREALDTIARGIREACQDAFLFGPDDVRLVAPGAVPRTTSGKVRRQACRRWYEDLVSAATLG